MSVVFEDALASWEEAMQDPWLETLIDFSTTTEQDPWLETLIDFSTTTMQDPWLETLIDFSATIEEELGTVSHDLCAEWMRPREEWLSVEADMEKCLSGLRLDAQRNRLPPGSQNPMTTTNQTTGCSSRATVTTEVAACNHTTKMSDAESHTENATYIRADVNGRRQLPLIDMGSQVSLCNVSVLEGLPLGPTGKRVLAANRACTPIAGEEWVLHVKPVERIVVDWWTDSMHARGSTEGDSTTRLDQPRPISGLPPGESDERGSGKATETGVVTEDKIAVDLTEVGPTDAIATKFDLKKLLGKFGDGSFFKDTDFGPRAATRIRTHVPEVRPVRQPLPRPQAADGLVDSWVGTNLAGETASSSAAGLLLAERWMGAFKFFGGDRPLGPAEGDSWARRVVLAKGATEPAANEGCTVDWAQVSRGGKASAWDRMQLVGFHRPRFKMDETGTCAARAATESKTERSERGRGVPERYRG
jgi:hypothetical protein